MSNEFAPLPTQCSKCGKAAYTSGTYCNDCFQEMFDRMFVRVPNPVIPDWIGNEPNELKYRITQLEEQNEKLRESIDTVHRLHIKADNARHERITKLETLLKEVINPENHCTYDAWVEGGWYEIDMELVGRIQKAVKEKAS